MARIIQDEFTERKDLTPQQKWKLRNPEKWNEVKAASSRKTWAKKSHKERATKALKRSYGITFDEYEQLVIAQNYKCRTCSTQITTEPGPLKGVVDHDHYTLRIRGILCNHCNKALGLVYENTNTLRNMIAYLNG